MSRRRWLAAGAAAAVVAAGGAAVVFAGGDDSGVDAARKSPPATADIIRGDLVDTTSVDGTLTYTGERTVPATAAGTVTRVPALGSVIKQGRALFEVDRRPLVLMYGSLPLYRTLRQGIGDGPDVQQLEKALKALGYGHGMTADRHFSLATAQAVRDWQQDHRLGRTGAVDASEVVFLPSPMRVTTAKIAVGDQVRSGQPALTMTSDRRLVHVDLNADSQELVKRGAPVTVRLPGGVTTKGRVGSVGTVARKKADPAGASGQNAQATIDVEIELTGEPKTGRWDQAPVTVTLESERRKNVLTVPVEALLALREGGYGVEVAGPAGARRIVAVRTGAYGSGRVEISGSGIAAGMKVGVPAQ